MKVRTVVAGVFVGMWLFVLSVVLLSVALGWAALDSLPFPDDTTTTLPTVPLPATPP